MEKQRMFKMSQLEQDMLVKALCDIPNFGQQQVLGRRTVSADCGEGDCYESS